MRLKLFGVCKERSNIIIQRNFEAMGDNLLLLKLEIFPKCASPYHWLLEDKRKPPFDIAINPDNGFISYIKFFFQDEKVQKANSDISSGKQEYGFPQFDIGCFSDKTYHVFGKGRLDAVLQGRNLFLIIPKSNCNRCLNLDENSAILFDDEGMFIGVLLRSLSNEELQEFINASILE